MTTIDNDNDNDNDDKQDLRHRRLVRIIQAAFLSCAVSVAAGLITNAVWSLFS